MFSSIFSQNWQLFVVIGIVLILLEMVSFTFYFLAIGIGFLLASLFAYFVDNAIFQWLMLAFNIFLTFIIFKKYIMPHQKGKRFLSNSEGMIGKEVIVSEKIDSKKQEGYIKLYGDLWKALSTTNEEIQQGETVIIDKIEGNKVFVSRKKV